MKATALLLIIPLLALPAVHADWVAVDAPTGHVGAWIPGITSTNAPRDLWVDRSSGVSNVLTWSAPASTDGQSIVGYWLYRTPAVGPGLASVFVTGTSYTDAAASFDHTYVYFVTVVLSDGMFQTESLPSIPVVAQPYASYPYCTLVHIETTYPYVHPDPFCLWPPPV